MSDDILERAIAERDRLADELRRVNDFIATYRTLAQTVRLDEARNVPIKAQRTTSNPKPAHVTDHAVAVLREARRPMTRRQLHAALLARGVEVRGADPIKTLGTMLWRSGRLKMIEGAGYWPLGVNLPKSSESST